MKRLTILAAALLLLVTPSIAQEQDRPQPDRWRGLVIDQSTPDDAIKTLGQPESDKPGGFKPYPLEKRLDTKGNDFRHLVYKKLEGVKLADLVFKDGKLISIGLELDKSIDAAALQNIYGVSFEPKFSNMDTAMSPGDYERNRGRLFAKDFPTVYYLISKTEHSYVSAMVDNGSFKSMMLGSNQGSTGEGAFPGKTKFISLISLSLENKRGANVLK